MLNNVLKVLRSFVGWLGIFIGILIIAFPSFYFMDSGLIISYLGFPFYIAEITLTTIIAILFGFFIGGTLFKINHFSIKKSGIGIIGGFLGALVSGCPACSITLAYYLGLAGFMYIFPYHGLELKVFSVLILFYVNYSVIHTLEVCKIKNK